MGWRTYVVRGMRSLPGGHYTTPITLLEVDLISLAEWSRRRELAWR
jgi:hypothetical protein